MISVKKIKADSNVYVIDDKIVIDTGRDTNRAIVKEGIDCNKIEVVVFTHLHYDHIGNCDLFSNAKFYASSTEIDSFKKDPFGTVLNKEGVEKLNKITLNVLKKLDGFDVISTPGHTAGSICLFYENVMFSGDTLFYNGYGRVDLPTSKPELMESSLKKLEKYKYDTLYPGHEY